MRFLFGYCACFGLMLLMLAAGCATPVRVSHRMPSYRPEVDQVTIAGSVVEVDANGDAVGAAETPFAGMVREASSEAQAQTFRPHGRGLRILGRGDRLQLYLRGIPQPEEIRDVVDGFGEITLPYIGQVRVVGKTTAQVERMIETHYVEEGIYNQINVVVVAQKDDYFVQGEVERQGKFPLSGKATLLQAISEAGGYTPFAHRKKIKVIRGNKVLFFNGKDIAEGEVPDPIIKPDDIIEVLRKVF